MGPEAEKRRIYWLALNLALHGEHRLMERVVSQFSGLERVFEAEEADLRECGVEEEMAASLASGVALRKARKVAERLSAKAGWVILREDPDYPPLLREIANPPFLIYGMGRKEVLSDPAVAIVGTRRPSPYGRVMAEKLASELAARGMVIVSGFARGIDSFAHTAALKEGLTVAVLGSGLERIYPSENARLFRHIAERGAVITEYPPEEPPLSHHFPWRNRVISGLSLATIVVEASRRSGSLITARLALEQNREVMAVPGRAGNELSQGTNGLIKSGAKLVESWEDVVLELPSGVRDAILWREKKEAMAEAQIPVLEEGEKAVMACLSPDEATSVEEMVLRTGLPVPELLAILLQLELKGLVISNPGPSYQRSA